MRNNRGNKQNTILLMEIVEEMKDKFEHFCSADSDSHKLLSIEKVLKEHVAKIEN